MRTGMRSQIQALELHVKSAAGQVIRLSAHPQMTRSSDYEMLAFESERGPNIVPLQCPFSTITDGEPFK